MFSLTEYKLFNELRKMEVSQSASQLYWKFQMIKSHTEFNGVQII